MTKAGKDHKPHLGLAVAVSGAMALGLAVGLDFLKVMDRIDTALAELMVRPGLSVPPNSVSPTVLWIATGALSFLLPAVVLNVAATWRRLMIWAATLALTLFWGPVLVLAAHKPEIGVAVVAVLWSGFCAMVYATNHVMPADEAERDAKEKDHGTR